MFFYFATTIISSSGHKPHSFPTKHDYTHMWNLCQQKIITRDPQRSLHLQNLATLFWMFSTFSLFIYHLFWQVATKKKNTIYNIRWANCANSTVVNEVSAMVDSNKKVWFTVHCLRFTYSAQQGVQQEVGPTIKKILLTHRVARPLWNWIETRVATKIGEESMMRACVRTDMVVCKCVQGLF